MENTGNFYDDNREGDTTQRHEEATPQAENPEAKISGAVKWARRIFTTLAITGWIVIGVLILDVMFNNSKIIQWIMIGK